MAHHDLLPGVAACHWGHFDATLAPVLEIDPGDTVTVESLSGAPEHVRDAPGAIRAELRAIHAALSPAPGAHILTGPIAVRGAEPGDALRIEIQAIELRDDWGYNLSAPGKGALPDDFAEPSLRHFAIDRDRATIATPWGIELPARPFFGVIGVAPAFELGRVTSIIPGAFGGNMDNRELVPGATLHLPVFVPGALLSVGDGHAIQGDGEVNVTAVETGLRGTFRVCLEKRAALDAPEAETPTHLIAMAFDEDLDTAARLATRRAVAMVARRSGLDAPEAYALLSLVGDLRVTQLVRKGIHVMIPKRHLPSPRGTA